VCVPEKREREIARREGGARERDRKREREEGRKVEQLYREHGVGKGGLKKVLGPGDMEVHLGTDGVYTQQKEERRGGGRGTHTHRRSRRERGAQVEKRREED